MISRRKYGDPMLARHWRDPERSPDGALVDQIACLEPTGVVPNVYMITSNPARVECPRCLALLRERGPGGLR